MDDFFSAPSGVGPFPTFPAMPDPRFAAFAQAAGNARPMFGAPFAPPVANPFQIPGMGSSPLGMMAGQFLIPPLMQQFGLTPQDMMGGFSLSRQQRDQALMAQMMSLRPMMQPMDMRSAQRITRRIGGAFGLDDAFTDRLAGMMTNPMVQMGVVPGVLGAMGLPQGDIEYLQDAMFGARGSAQLMGQRLAIAGTRMLDPMTGRMGLGNETIAGLTDRLQRERDRNPAAFQNLRMGEIGSMIGEAQQRGILYRPIASQSAAGQDAAIGDFMLRNRVAGPAGQVANNLADAVAAAKEMTSDQRANLMKDVDIERIATRTKDLAKAVKAMKSIFGDEGMPNAPMSEIMKALDGLSQGDLRRMSGGRLAQMAMTGQVAGEMTGAGMYGFTSAITRVASELGRRGISSKGDIAANMAVAGLTFGRAVQENEFGLTATGSIGADEATMIRERQTAAAGASPLALRLAALGNYADTASGVPKGSQADALLRAARSGATEYQFNGRTYSMPLSQAQLDRVLESSGVDMRTFNTMSRDDAANRRLVAGERGIIDAVGSLQYREAGMRAAQSATSRMSAEAARAGISPDQLRSSITAATAAFVEDKDLPVEVRNDPNKRIDYIAARMAEDLDRQGIKYDKDALRALASSANYNLEGHFSKQGNPYGSFQAYITANSRANRDRGGELELQAQVQASMNNALNAQGGSGALERAMELAATGVLEGDFKGGGFGKFMGRLLGGMDPSQIEGAFANITDDDAKRMGIKDPKAFARAYTAMLAARKGGAGAGDALANERAQVASGVNAKRSELDRRAVALQEEYDRAVASVPESDADKRAQMRADLGNNLAAIGAERKKMDEEAQAKGKQIDAVAAERKRFEDAMAGGGRSAASEYNRLVRELTRAGVTTKQIIQLEKGEIGDDDLGITRDALMEKYGPKYGERLSALQAMAAGGADAEAAAAKFKEAQGQAAADNSQRDALMDKARAARDAYMKGVDRDQNLQAYKDSVNALNRGGWSIGKFQPVGEGTFNLPAIPDTLERSAAAKAGAAAPAEGAAAAPKVVFQEGQKIGIEGNLVLEDNRPPRLEGMITTSNS